MWVKLALLATAERIVGSYRGVAPGSAGQEINALSASLFFLLKIPPGHAPHRHTRLIGTSEPLYGLLVCPVSITYDDVINISPSPLVRRLLPMLGCMYLTHHGSRVAYPKHSANLLLCCRRFFHYPKEDPFDASLSQRGPMVAH